MMRLACVAVTHRTAPIAIRERLGFPVERQRELLRAWCGSAEEAVLLVTCHRTELYWVAPQADPHVGLAWLATEAMLTADRLATCAWCGSEARAVRHLMRVAAGLDSRVVGEAQILGQVRRARDLARQSGTLGPVTDRLFALALAAGRSARIQSGIVKSERSLAGVAVREVERRVGDLSRSAVLVLGAGETGRLVVSVLRRRQPRMIWWSNRSSDRFPRWAQEAGVELLDWSSWPRVVAEADVVFVTTGAPQPVLDRAHLSRTERTQLIVDLSVPRNVDPDVAQLPSVRLMTVDDLPEDAETAEGERCCQRADLVVELFVERFMRWYRAHALAPELAATREALRVLCEREIARAVQRIRNDPQGVERIVQRASLSLTDKVLAPVYRSLERDPQQAVATLRLLRALQ